MKYNELSKDDILNRIACIEGWFGSREMELMYKTVSGLQGNGCIVEIGSWCGRSLTLMTLTARKFLNACKVFSIDPFLTSKDEDNGKFPTFKKNLEDSKIWPEITHIREKSHQAAKMFDEKIELLFIDGFHKYDYVKKDFELFSQNVVDGGFIALHDVGSYYGPTKLVQEILEADSYKAVGYQDSTFMFQKNFLTEDDKIENKNFLEKINRLFEEKDLVM